MTQIIILSDDQHHIMMVDNIGFIGNFTPYYARSKMLRSKHCAIATTGPVYDGKEIGLLNEVEEAISANKLTHAWLVDKIKQVGFSDNLSGFLLIGQHICLICGQDAEITFNQFKKPFGIWTDGYAYDLVRHFIKKTIRDNPLINSLSVDKLANIIKTELTKHFKELIHEDYAFSVIDSNDLGFVDLPLDSDNNVYRVDFN